MPRPRDVLMDRPQILFVGINPGGASGVVGHHFAGPNNPFWRLLHAAGLTPTVLRAEDDGRLVDHGYALVNLCPRPTRAAAELTRAELVRGARELRKKIRAIQPEIVALVGVTLYPRVMRAPDGTRAVLTPGPPQGGPSAQGGLAAGHSPRSAGLGPGLKPDRLEGARVFVMPNPSGLKAAFPSFDSKLVWFRQLAELVGRGNPSATSK